MTSYAVVGASRGIGLEYVRQLAARSNTTVFAVVRNARTSTHLTAAIAGLKNVHVLEADVTDHKSLESAAKKLSDITGGKLDYLIHTAARMDFPSVLNGFDDFASMDELDKEFITAFKINSLGVVHSISAFLPLLRRSPTKKIIVINAGGADHKMVRSAKVAMMAAYGITKAAALNATTKWAAKLKDEGFVVVSLSPGFVDTSGTIGPSGDATVHAISVQAAEGFAALGVPLKLQSPEESVADQLKVIDGLRPEDNGMFLSHKGGEFEHTRG